MKIFTKKSSHSIPEMVVEIYMKKFDSYFRQGSNVLESENIRIEFERKSKELILNENHEEFLANIVSGLQHTKDDERILISFCQYCPPIFLFHWSQKNRTGKRSHNFDIFKGI